MNTSALFLGLLMFSFIVTSILIVPFINMLYRLRFQRAQQKTKDVFGAFTTIFDKFHAEKAGTPVGGGFLVIVVVSILFALIIPALQLFGIPIISIHTNLSAEIQIFFVTFLSFGALGLYDDIKKFFKLESRGFFGMRMRHKLFVQITLALLISCMLYFQLHISFVNVPFIDNFELGVFFIPFASFTIVAFANAVNVTDGLDGLAAGNLMITLFGLWFLSISDSLMDVPIATFIALWLGALISFLYFNVYPARMFMGDVGSMAFGAALAVVGLLLGKIIALIIISSFFVIEITSSLLQLLSKKFRKKKILPAAPFHLTLQHKGWEEPKIVQRAWLVQIMLTIFGMWLALL